MMKDFLNSCLETDWKAVRLKGDSGERHYSRIRSSKGSFIFASHPDSNKNFENFVAAQEFLNKYSMPIPRVFYVDKKNKFLLLEDLGCLDVETFYLQNKELSYHFKALDVLYSFQKVTGFEQFKKKFSTAQGLHEMLTAYQNLGLTLHHSHKEKLLKEFQNICFKLSQEPFIPSHRDFHSRNLLIHQGRVYMIDFQDAGLYPRYYDLVSFVYDAYALLSSAEKKRLIQYYEKKWGQSVCEESIQLTFCQRTFKAVGSFMKFYNLRKQTRHLKYVKPCLLELESHLKSMKQYPCFLNYVRSLSDML